METLFKQERKRRPNGQFATAQQAFNDKLKRRNEYLELKVEQLERELQVFTKMVLRREIIIQ